MCMYRMKYTCPSINQGIFLSTFTGSKHLIKAYLSINFVLPVVFWFHMHIFYFFPLFSRIKDVMWQQAGDLFPVSSSTCTCIVRRRILLNFRDYCVWQHSMGYHWSSKFLNYRVFVFIIHTYQREDSVCICFIIFYLYNNRKSSLHKYQHNTYKNMCMDSTFQEIFKYMNLHVLVSIN